MNIGVIGWWHYDNQGDFRILECLTEALAPHRVTPIDTSFEINSGVLDRLNALDFIILGGGGLFQQAPTRPFDTFDRWAADLKTPIGVLGLGIDQVRDEYRPAVEALVERSEFFVVRDRASQEAVNHPKIEVAPDLTFLHPLEAAGRESRPSELPLCGVNLRLAGGLPAARWVAALSELPLRFRGIPLSAFEDWQEITLVQQLDGDCRPDFSPALYDGLDLMIGTAFHSVLFAIQTAVPVIALAYAPKVQRLMDEIGLGDYALSLEQWDQLPALVDRVLNERTQLTEQLAQITADLQRDIQATLARVRAALPADPPTRPAAGHRVSVVLIDNGDAETTRTSLESCLNQTWPALEILVAGPNAPELSDPRIKVVACDPAASPAEWINHTLEHAGGELVTWLAAGDEFAYDAIAYLAHQLEQAPDADAVYTEFVTLDANDRIEKAHVIEPAAKLFRRNVVGPSFLLRQKLFTRMGGLRPDSPLPDYDFWLRAGQDCHLRPVRGHLFYHRPAGDPIDLDDQKRATRRGWRAGMALPKRIAWNLIDSRPFERWITRPLLALWRRTKAGGTARQRQGKK